MVPQEWIEHSTPSLEDSCSLPLSYWGSNLVEREGIEPPTTLDFTQVLYLTELPFLKMVRAERFELSRGNPHWFLRPACMPFHHAREN